MPVFTKSNTIRDKSSISFNTPSSYAKDNLMYLEMFGQFFCDRRYMVERGPFNSYLLLLTKDGSGMVETKQQKHTCRKNDLTLIDCSKWHKYYASNYWEFYWLHVNGSSSKVLAEHFLQKQGMTVRMHETALTMRYFKALAEGEFDNRIDQEILISAHLHSILADMITAPSASQKPAQKSNMVTEAIAFINYNFEKNLNIDGIAARFGVSKSTFCHVFKKETGFPPYDFILNRRFNEAKFLLKSTDKPVGEVAYDVGFQSEANFIKLFKQRHDMTPRTFRSIVP